MTTKRIDGDSLDYISLKNAHILKTDMVATRNVHMEIIVTKPTIESRNFIILTSIKPSSVLATLTDKIKSAIMENFAPLLILKENSQ
jgi:hypothetical protein